MRRRGERGQAMVLAALMITVLIGFVVFFVGLGGGLPNLGGTYQVRALLPTAGSLTPGARVTMAGSRVGSVTAVARRGSGAVVSMTIDDSPAGIPSFIPRNNSPNWQTPIAKPYPAM